MLKARGGSGICAGPGGVRSSGGRVTLTTSPVGGDNRSGYMGSEVVSSAAWMSQVVVETGWRLSEDREVMEAVVLGC